MGIGQGQGGQGGREADARVVVEPAAVLVVQLLELEGQEVPLALEFLPARIEIVPSGVDVPALEQVPAVDYREEFGIPPAAPVVGDVAHFGWHKAQEVLVEACPRLWELVPDAHVILVGDGDCREKVEKALADLRRVFLRLPAEQRGSLTRLPTAYVEGLHGKAPLDGVAEGVHAPPRILAIDPEIERGEDQMAMFGG